MITRKATFFFLSELIYLFFLSLTLDCYLGSQLNVYFISCVSSEVRLFWMFILNCFSHPRVRSSWKSVPGAGGRGGWRFVCLGVIQKPLLISSLVTEYVFRKASVFDMFEALCETSETIWSNWKWQLCSKHMALFSLLSNAGGMQIMPGVTRLSQFHILYPSVP